MRRLIIIIFCYLAISAPLINRPLTHDEIRNTFMYLETSPLSASGAGWGCGWKGQLAIHPPFLSTLYYFWIRAFGDSETSVHIPPVLAGLLGIILLYFLGRSIFGEDIAFPAALACAFSVAHITYSAEAVHAIFEGPVLTASLLCLYKFMITGKKKAFAVLLLLNAAGIFIFYHYLAYLLVQTLALWFYRKKLEISKYYFIAILAILAVFFKFVVNGFSEGYFSYGFWLRHDLKTVLKVIGTLPYRGIGIEAVPARYAGIFLFRHFFAFFSLPFLLLFLAGYVRILTLFGKTEEPQNLLKLVLAATFAAPFIFYFIVGMLGVKFGHPRNFFYLTPVYFLVVFYGLKGLSRSKKAFYFLATAIVGFFLASGIAYASYYWPPVYKQRSMIGYAAKVDADYVFVPAARIDPWVFNYYTKKHNSPDKVRRLYTADDNRLIRREAAELDYREQFKKVPAGKRIAVVEMKGDKITARFISCK